MELIVVLRIAIIVRKFIPKMTPKYFGRTQLLEQSNIWLTKVITTRESMPRTLPPGAKYIPPKDTPLGTYTKWGREQVSDMVYVRALWELGSNHEVIFNLLSHLIIAVGS
jgi:hypothetical protein